MKTFYLIKPFLPFAFLPAAPGVIQAALSREGVLAPTGELLTITLQVIFTVGLFAWIAYTLNRKSTTQVFLKMSSLSKKVFHQDQWMTVEQYLAQHHNVVVSHGLTPEEWEDWVRESEEYLGTELPEIKNVIRRSHSIEAADKVAA